MTAAAQDLAKDVPGGAALAKLMLGRAQNFLRERDEDELRRYLMMAQAVAGTILTGEGYDELMKATAGDQNVELVTGDNGGSAPDES